MSQQAEAFLFPDMTIVPAEGEARRFAYGDNRSGYLELFSALRPEGAGAGYVSSGTCLFRDFGLLLNQEGSKAATFLFRPLNGKTEIGPEGFMTTFSLPDGCSAQVFCSLLSGRRSLSFKLSLPPAWEGTQLVLFLPRELKSEGEDPLAPSFALSASGSVEEAALSLSSAGGEAERLAKRDYGCAAWKVSSSVSWSGVSLYLSFPSDGRCAPEEAAACASTLASDAHRALIRDLLTRASLKTGLAAFDSALSWCVASGWFLVTDEFGRGIWAGLPWFRDNWGRDTFIALPGILLATGRFKEAREVLVNFARYQKTDPEDPDFGRIPNRVASPADIIYNTVDGTPWFVRECLEYLEYTGDGAFAREILPVVERAIAADYDRLDASGFLRHGHADTWMDARIDGGHPWSARGDRAVEIQALWYTALLSAARLAEAAGRDGLEPEEAKRRLELVSGWRGLAERVKEAFLKAFWKEDEAILADRLAPESEGGGADYRNRPNQLLLASVPTVLDDGKASADAAFIPPSVEAALTRRAVSRLLYPWGMASLDQEDPLFHPAHEDPEHWHKDAAYHNGTVWLWNSGPAVEALCRAGQADLAWKHSLNLAEQVLLSGCAGSLSENLHAHPDAKGKIVHSGTWSQAWSVSEFTRTAYQAYLGFKPRLSQKAIILEPSLPAAISTLSARLPFGIPLSEDAAKAGGPAKGEPAESLSISYQRDAEKETWKIRRSLSGGPLSLIFRPSWQGRRLEYSLDLPPGAELCLVVDRASGRVEGAEGRALERPGPGGRALERPGPLPFLDFAQARLPSWNPATKKRDFLRSLILAGRYDAGPRASLEEVFSSPAFMSSWHFDGKLGSLWSADRTVFRLWAPTAESVTLSLYASGSGGAAESTLPMERSERGVWTITVEGNLDGRYYDYLVSAHGRSRRACDPYARAAGVNGKRAMVLDFSRSNPPGWAEIAAPSLRSPADAVVAELHVADLTSHPSWKGESALRRTYLGAAQRGTSWSPGAGQEAVPTGLEHFVSLGVTHLQLLPIHDFDTVDEARARDADYLSRKYHGAFNWGYDPANYSVPEGSYSTDPQDGACRVREYKALIMAIRYAGMGVIMDVVFNHMPDLGRSSLEACVPGYYFRADDFAGCGADTASERSMFRAFMIDSLSWWLSEYKVSGFRFDLMGLHDVQTMRDAERALQAIKPDVLLYGEGWDMYRGSAMTPASMMRPAELGHIGMFNDAFRCGLKGTTFDPHAPGWLHDGRDSEALKFGIVGAVRHPQVHSSKVKGTSNGHPWSEEPWRSISYTEIHDNLTLHDKLVLVEPDAPLERIERLVRMALTFILCSEGMPILHAGMEFLRTKEFPSDWVEEGGLRKEFFSKDGKRAFCHDSYCFSDLINALDWGRAWEHRETVEYARGLVRLRKEHPLLRLRTGEELRKRLRFLEDSGGLLSWRLDGSGSEDPWKGILVAGNAGKEARKHKLPGGSWLIVADGKRLRPEGLCKRSGSVEIPPETALVLRLE